MACLVGLPSGFDFLRDHEASLGSPPVPFNRFIPGGFLRWMSPERHVATKEAFRNAMVRDVHEPLEPFMRATIRAELGRMADASDASDGQGVPPRRHVQRMVFAIWMRLFFHVEPHAPELQRLKALYAIVDMRNPTGASNRAVKTALAAIAQLLRDRLATVGPAGAEPPGSFLEALVRSHPRSLDDPGVLLNVVYMAHTTWSDVSGLLQWLFRMLTDHPEWAGRLRSDDPDGSSLSTRIVMETLRLEQSEHLYRVAKREIEHDGFVIPRGWLVRLCVRESHQDPGVFENPRSFDPDRFLSRSYTRREYSPFGAGGRYACLGEGLTKAVGHLFVEELARGYEWRTVSDGPYEYSAWRHWRPASTWRVLVTPRQ
jgi:cytochrome P450